MNINEVTFSLSEILVAIMTLVAAALGFKIREQREQIKTIQNQLSDKKYKVYHEVYSIFFDIIKEQKGMTDKKGLALSSRLIDLKKDLFIYAPDNIVHKFIDWNLATNAPSGNRHFDLFLELFILIRKDMGHKETVINSNDILRAIVVSEEEFQKLKKTI
jgi:hypothetical protein